MRDRRRTMLVALLVLLALLACGLGAFYVWIGQPVKSAQPVVVEGLTHERSIYPPTAKQAVTFKQPSRIGVEPNGDMLVSVPTSKAVVRVTQAGAVIGRLEPKTPFASPAGVGVWPDGTAWVCDWPIAQIVVFDADGKEVKRISMVAPLSINIAGDRAYVTSIGTVSVLNKAGTQLTVFGRGRGAGDGQLDMPHGAIPAGKDLVIGDSLNARVLRLGPDNKPVWSVGYREKGITKAPEGPYNVPTDLLIGQGGYAFVLDTFTSQISVVDPKNGKVLKQVGEIGSKDGQFLYPEGLGYLGGDRYAVADKFNNRIQIVRIPLPGAATGSGPADLITRIGPGDVGVLLLWCALPLAVVLLALVIFLVVRGRRRATEDAEDEVDVTHDTEYLDED
jgi:hypothetical protein